MKRFVVLVALLVGVEAHAASWSKRCARGLVGLGGVAAVVWLDNVFLAPTERWENYGPVIGQAARKDPGSGYVNYPEFPHLEVVKDGTGEINPAAFAAISDPAVAQLIEKGKFTTLDARNFAVLSSSRTANGNEFGVPFVISIKHTRLSGFVFNFYQGTIDVFGDIRTELGVTRVIVRAIRFRDSRANGIWPLEMIGRSLGFLDPISFRFASAISKSQLERFFNEDPSHLRVLNQIAGWNQIKKLP